MDPLWVARHVLFWSVFFSIILFFAGYEAVNRNFFLIDLPITLIYTYVSAYLFIPFFMARKRYVILVLLLIIFSLFLSYLRLTNYNYYYYSMFAPKLAESASAVTFSMLILNSKDFSFGLFIFLAVKYTLHWFKFEKSKIEVENEQLESEIRLMKTQIDHHFLFNTLNNIYSLSVTEPDKTRYAVKKLWGLLDFLVNQAKFKEIRIEKELKLISDYVELERLRYGERLDFEFRIERNLKDYRIPPLILYPLIENCFKHGSSLDPGNPWIKIEVKEMEDRIRFRAMNSKKHSRENELDRIHKTRTLDRIRKRLEYQLQGRFKLRIEDETDRYTVLLDILY